MRKRGFTLVELSIVLVIIGLLIGGILVAQSMIKTAKVQSVVRQISQYDVAISNFRTKYNQLPGNSNLFGACSPSTACSNSGTTDGNGYDIGYSWLQLSLGVGLLNQQGASYTRFDPFSVTTTATCPQLNIDQDQTAASCLAILWQAGQGNYYYYEGPMAAPPNTAQPLKPADLQALDIKMDDGFPTSGFITNGGHATAFCGQNPKWWLYNTSYNGYACGAQISIGITGATN